MSDLKWLACEGISLNPYNLSVPERLRDFGYALVFDEFGNGKTDKAQLCIHSVLSAERSSSDGTGANPSILIICPESLLQNWYTCLVSEMGVDFKFISDLDDTVFFHSKSISNLFIISEEQLKRSGKAGLMGETKFVWDLLIIDTGLGVLGVDWEGYSANCANKANKVLVFAPFPFPYDEDSSASACKKMLKDFLNGQGKKASVSGLVIDENIINFNPNTPAMRYCIPGKTKGRGPNVVLLEYEIDASRFNASTRLAETREGVPFYIYGGNAFEEFNPPEKTTYLLPNYDKDAVETLRRADAKLNVFLIKLAEVLKSPENNAVIYFTSKATLNYIAKVIYAVYADSPDLKDRVLIQTDSVLDGGFLKRRFIGKTPVKARIILAGDSIDEKYYGIQHATHIFNYEYPANPTELERRFLRTGRSFQTGRSEIGNERPEEFIVFTDTALRFDGRVLSKVMMSRLPMCFGRKIPTRNVLFWVPDAEMYISETLNDLKRIIEEIKEFNEDVKDSHGDFAKLSRSFRKNYNVTNFKQVETEEKLHDYALKLFDELVRLLDVNSFATIFETSLEEHIGDESLPKLVKKSIETIRRDYLYYDELMNPKLIRNTNNPDEIVEQYNDNEFVSGVQDSVIALEILIGRAAGDYPYIRDAVAEVPEELRTPVLYNIWKYCRFKKGATQSLREFMELYNKGVI
ncbi:MAG: hypothetical protein FWG83_02600 [Oscillospiraceae bacterium]|nr:hypothetical protein [Oscillospiraceae bacterium]